MNRSHKIRLAPTKKQEILLHKTAGTTRYAYNWAKAQWDADYLTYKEAKSKGELFNRPSALTLSKRWTEQRPEWSTEVSRCPQTKAIMNLGQAYISFWNNKASHPTFKKKGIAQSFYVDNTKASVSGKYVKLPCIGRVRMQESLRFDGKIMSYTVSHKAGQWHVSIQVEMPDKVAPAVDSTVGVDVGISKIAVASDGTVLNNPKNLPKAQSSLRRKQRRLSRQRKGSVRRARTKLAIGRQHLRITNIRNDSIHKFTSGLAKNHSTAVIETLSIESMKGEKWMNRLLQDTAMREVHRQLEYKMFVHKAPDNFPSTKRCSSCGHVKEELPCSIRVYKCLQCGNRLDRDLNASLNLEYMPWVTGSMRGKGATAPVHREVEQ